MKAICYFRNGIGNLALMMPAVQALMNWTGKCVDFCLDDNWTEPRRKTIEEILESWATVGKVLCYPRDPVDMTKYDLWMYSKWNDNSEAARLFDRMNKERGVEVPARPNWAKLGIHEVDHYMEVVRCLGYKGDIPRVKFPLADFPIIERIGTTVGICNGAQPARHWQLKRWPRFAEFAEVCRKEMDWTVIGIGLPGELDGVRVNMRICGTITQAARALQQMDVLISPDTGCMHIADIMDVPIVALFGPTLTFRSYPRNNRSILVKSPTECSPCQGDKKRWVSCMRGRCMEDISVETVVRAVSEVLGGGV